MAADPQQSDDAPIPGHPLTIDELGRESGMTVRTIRSHQARGLLPPPEVHRRTGYYGAEHVARLRMIQELQGQGFNLKGIRRLLEDLDAPAERLLALKQAITAGFEPGPREVVTAAELAERFGAGDEGGEALGQAVKLGLLAPLGGGRFEARIPALLRAAEQVTDRGVPLPVALHAVEGIQRRCESISRDFVELFLRHVWEPFEDAGTPADQWPQITETIEQLRPIASEVVLAVFAATMTEQVEAGFGKVLERRARKGGRG